MNASDADNLPVIPGYKIEKKLAQGGMGVVFLATDSALGRRVAIKMIRAEFVGSTSDVDDEKVAIARFNNEARAAAQINSAHVAHVLSFGETQTGDLYLVLEYLDGITLNDLIKREKRLDVQRAVQLTKKICHGLKSAHALGIVHRDLKPSNIMLVDQDGDKEFVKILDFGVAKKLADPESDVTKTGALIGTHTSMAPEQITGSPIDMRTDIYAVGCLLYRLLTGRVPFAGSDFVAVLHAHLHKIPDAPSTVRGDGEIPRALDAVVLRCLAKNPDERVKSVEELERLLGMVFQRNADLTVTVALGAPLSDLPVEIDVEGSTFASKKTVPVASQNSAPDVSKKNDSENVFNAFNDAVAQPVDVHTPLTGTRGGMAAAGLVAVTSSTDTMAAAPPVDGMRRFAIAALAGSVIAFGVAVLVLWRVVASAPGVVTDVADGRAHDSSTTGGDRASGIVDEDDANVDERVDTNVPPPGQGPDTHSIDETVGASKRDVGDDRADNAQKNDDSAGDGDDVDDNDDDDENDVDAKRHAKKKHTKRPTSTAKKPTKQSAPPPTKSPSKDADVAAKDADVAAKKDPTKPPAKSGTSATIDDKKAKEPPVKADPGGGFRRVRTEGGGD